MYQYTVQSTVFYYLAQCQVKTRRSSKEMIWDDLTSDHLKKMERAKKLEMKKVFSNGHFSLFLNRNSVFFLGRSANARCHKGIQLNIHILFVEFFIK